MLTIVSAFLSRVAKYGDIDANRKQEVVTLLSSCNKKKINFY